MYGWAWFWMSLTMVFWLLAFAGLVYVAVRLALRSSRDGSFQRDGTGV